MTACLNGIRWSMTACQDCAGTGTQTSKWRGQHPHNTGTRRRRCMTCGANGYLRSRIEWEKS